MVFRVRVRVRVIRGSFSVPTFGLTSNLEWRLFKVCPVEHFCQNLKIPIRKKVVVIKKNIYHIKEDNGVYLIFYDASRFSMICLVGVATKIMSKFLILRELFTKKGIVESTLIHASRKNTF